MAKVKIGVIGVSGMGGGHARDLMGGKVANAELAAVGDLVPAAMAPFPVKHFTTSEDMIASGVVDAVIIATPHFSHTTIGVDALSKGLHVLVEKPISVHKADAEKLIAAHKDKSRIFAAMFNQRTNPQYKKIRSLIQSGELGEIRRVNWIITDWFRTNAYYASGGWRATWGGEGGGVLLNQCPHNLDLIYWLFGMPKKIRAFCKVGRYHSIEVEDDATAYFEYENGMTLSFVTSTGEAPGTNRLEINGEKGRLVCEHDKLHFIRNEIPMSEFSRTTSERFGRPPSWNVEIPLQGPPGSHAEIMNNFADAIVEGKKLVSPAEEGIFSIELANAMILSSFREKTVTLPMDSKEYETLLNELIAKSSFKKKMS